MLDGDWSSDVCSSDLTNDCLFVSSPLTMANPAETEQTMISSRTNKNPINFLIADTSMGV
jgi:hypothetical protein